MKTLTVHQPYASLIIEGIKDIENRSWKTGFRGRVLIHAGSKSAGWMKDLLNKEQEKIVGKSPKGLRFFEFDDFEFSVILGSVEIVDCVVNHDSIWAEKTEVINDPEIPFLPAYGKKTYNWVLANPIEFPRPIPAKGQQRLWNYPGIGSDVESPFGTHICLCSLPVSEVDQVRPLGGGKFECRYCSGEWYK